MNEEEIRLLLERYVAEVWSEGNLEAVKRFLHPDYRRHTSPELPPLDINSQLELLKRFKTAFPDASLVVEDVLTEGDRIAFRSTIEGSHLGSFIGIAATGRQVKVTLVDMMRIEEGLIIEQWGGPDMTDLVRQLQAK